MRQWPVRRQLMTCVGAMASFIVVATITVFVAQRALFPRPSGQFPLSEEWVYRADGRIFAISTSASELVFVRTNSELVAPQAETGNLTWQVKTTGRDKRSPVFVQGTAVFVGTTHGVGALDELTGQALWNVELLSFEQIT
jgi:outer membrane protein assembly factor BamB